MSNDKIFTSYTSRIDRIFFLKKRANLFIYFLFNKIKNIFILDIIWCTRATTEVKCQQFNQKT